MRDHSAFKRWLEEAKKKSESLNEGRGIPVPTSCVRKKFNPEIYLALRGFSEDQIKEIFEKLIEDTKSIKKGFKPSPIKVEGDTRLETERHYDTTLKKSVSVQKSVPNHHYSPIDVMLGKGYNNPDRTKKPIDVIYVSCKPVRLQLGDSSHAFYASFYDREDMENMRKALNANFSSLMTGTSPNVKVIEAKVSDRLDFFDIWLWNRISGGKADDIMAKVLHDVRGVISAGDLGIL